jgi:hypothetical protein
MLAMLGEAALGIVSERNVGRRHLRGKEELSDVVWRLD